VVLLLERALVSWSLAMDERDGHKDLHDSGRWSTIPYVHERTGVVLLKPALPEHFLFLTPMKRCLPDPFISQGWVVTMRLGARQVALWWLKPYTSSRALMARSS
jgi:hypothetical protein